MSITENTLPEVDDYSDVVMPYGKHVGTPISEVPLQYLAYIHASHNFSLYIELQRAIEVRLGLPPGPIRTGPPPTNPPVPAPRTQTGPIARLAQYTQPASNGHFETGLDGFRAALDRCRREVLIQYQNGSDAELEIVEHVFARVQAALGI